jgi:hypothetical protein
MARYNSRIADKAIGYIDQFSTFPKLFAKYVN